MWFGTLDGLNRYDGCTFIVYRPDPSDSNSIADLGVQNLLADPSGSLWISMAGGKLDCYDPDSDRFIHYLLEPPDTSKSGSPGYISMLRDAAGQMWLGVSNGWLYRYVPAKDRFIHQPFNNEDQRLVQDVHFTCLCPTEAGIIWIGSREGRVFKYDSNSGRIVSDLSLTIKNKALDDAIQAMVVDAAGSLWIATEENGLFVYNQAAQAVIHYRHDARNPNSLSSDNLYGLFKDSRSNLWIGSIDKGLDMFDPKKNSFNHFFHDRSAPWSLSDNAILSMYEDFSGGLWIGTFYGGVNQHNYRSQYFVNITHNPDNPASLSDNPILALCEDRQGRLWVGTDGGGLQFSLPGQRGFRYYFQDSDEIGSKCVTTVFEDRQGDIWFSTDLGDIFRIDQNKQSCTPFSEIPRSSGGVLTFYQDRLGELWIGTVFSGLYRYTPLTKTLRNYEYDEHNPRSISGNFVYSIHEDCKGTLWIGTRKAGLNRFDRTTETFTRFSHDPKDPNSLSDNTVFCIASDDSAILWLGTWGGGLNRYDRQTSTFRSFTSADGLPGDIVYSALPDQSGNLWLSANHGLGKFSVRTFSCRKYNNADGLLNHEFNQGAFCAGKDGRLYFGGAKGVAMIYPDSIRGNPHKPNIVLTGFNVFGKPLPLKKPVRAIEQISLSYRQNFFSFEFAALDFTAPHKNGYAYRLEGVDPHWVYAGNRHFASYTDIAPGRYVFCVKGSNSDGIWNEAGARITVIIRPPFWQTWWFRLLAIAALAGLLYAAHRYRLNKLLEVERTRNRIARDLHDEVSATLTGIAYFSTAIANETQHSRTPMLQKLLGLIQESVGEVQESMSDIIWSVNPENDRWETLLPKFRRYTSDLCESKGIRYEINIPQTYPAKFIQMERRRHLWLILKEMVTNAVKHAGCAALKINIEFVNRHIYLHVSDNGCGFDPHKGNDGNGLKNIQKRAALLQGEAKLETAPGAGTSWNMKIPLR